eukprot:CAMPEP_0181420682 /NCGR_PEP_ID=MMETSP1110-20121109/12711_1 /TAXON_ID=174948 /ORGANISM="Symbiodinium sp., Strain CCMP421" /LENGTH=52 /DNA_ID=CAMNT_0023543729 /DNA_START=564 /DNA_END=722 /DNA_ORIENTATION=+
MATDLPQLRYEAHGCIEVFFQSLVKTGWVPDTIKLQEFRAPTQPCPNLIAQV